MRNFMVEEDGNTFQFNSMNRRRAQLFQVYVMHEGQQKRFHMQINEESGDFHITDINHCPEMYHKSEKVLSDAIKIYGRLDKMPT
ncbi:MAG: hypothetical protein EOP46_13355 [Sphingobacteriaceae bacterium]|nr:MAG: hypothetical protein EOP46_13355 [Sphingobacteriaceae bacterium]